jgi:hypothetical protein
MGTTPLQPLKLKPHLPVAVSRPSRGRGKMGDRTGPPIFWAPGATVPPCISQVSEVEEAYSNSLYSLAGPLFCLLHWGLQNVETAGESMIFQNDLFFYGYDLL